VVLLKASRSSGLDRLAQVILDTERAQDLVRSGGNAA
jgi:hypothetical protein